MDIKENDHSPLMVHKTEHIKLNIEKHDRDAKE